MTVDIRERNVQSRHIGRNVLSLIENVLTFDGGETSTYYRVQYAKGAIVDIDAMYCDRADAEAVYDFLSRFLRVSPYGVRSLISALMSSCESEAIV